MNEPRNHRGKMMICWMWIWWWSPLWAQAFDQKIYPQYPLSTYRMIWMDMDGIMDTIIRLVWGKLMIIAVFFSFSVFFFLSLFGLTQIVNCQSDTISCLKRGSLINFDQENRPQSQKIGCQWNQHRIGIHWIHMSCGQWGFLASHTCVAGKFWAVH